jgi:hypothetical protein
MGRARYAVGGGLWRGSRAIGLGRERWRGRHDSQELVVSTTSGLVKEVV